MALIDKAIYCRFPGTLVSSNNINLVLDELAKNIRLNKIALKVLVEFCYRCPKI